MIKAVILEDSKNGILSALGSGSRIIAVNSMWRFDDESNIISCEDNLINVPNIIEKINTLSFR